jgi:hypothetical protein
MNRGIDAPILAKLIRLDHRHSSRTAMSSAAALPERLFFDLISTEEVNSVYELEVKGEGTFILHHVLSHRGFLSPGFPTDEAATIEKLW